MQIYWFFIDLDCGLVFTNLVLFLSEKSFFVQISCLLLIDSNY